MFTGLVEALGVIERVEVEGPGRRILIRWPDLDEPLALGESVAVNGCCLSIVGRAGSRFEVQAGPETLAKTNLGEKNAGSRVNLERSLRVGDRLGGHFVQGHVDSTAVLLERAPQADWDFLRFRLDRESLALLVPKGSIAVDGVSLTIVEVFDDGFSVMLIPITLADTTLGSLKPDDRVNVEVDMIAKHLRKLLSTYKNIL